jgi:fructose-1,6-bisphosphatase/inositol monophosphatase family enzyme
MMVLSTHVADGRFLVVVEKRDGMTLWELAAAEIAIEAALGCPVDVVTDGMIPPLRLREANSP